MIHDLVNLIIKALIQFACRVEADELRKVPHSGPLILATNHINFLEVPLVYIWLQPRPVEALIKIETMKNPFFGLLMKLWGGIPVKRGQYDRTALIQTIDSLKRGNILAIAPEGTRSKSGTLLQGQPGIIPVAQKSGAPILPLVFYGHEDFWENLKKFRKTDFKIVVGEPFQIKDPGSTFSREMRKEIADQIMFQLAVLLPEKYRGVYSDLDRVNTEYFTFKES